MKLAKAESRDRINADNRASIHSEQRRTLEAIFRHPTTTQVTWMDVVDLVAKIGSMDRRNNSEYVIHVGGKQHVMVEPHTKDLTGSEVVDLRHFLQHAGWSPEAPSEADAGADPAPPSLVVVLDHGGAKIYRIVPAAGDASTHALHPYDPHAFLHHLAQKDQSDANHQHASKEIAFHERIAEAVAAGGKIVVIDDGSSDKAGSLAEYLRTHHRETYQRMVSERTTDLANITQQELLALAEQALGLGDVNVAVDVAADPHQKDNR